MSPAKKKIEMVTNYDPWRCRHCEKFVEMKNKKGKIIPGCLLFDIKLSASKFPRIIKSEQKDICRQDIF